MVAQFYVKFFTTKDKLSVSNLYGEKQQYDKNLVSYVQKLRKKVLDCIEAIPERKLVKLCFKGMLVEYRIHIKNLILDFAKLITKARNSRTSISRINKFEDPHK